MKRFVNRSCVYLGELISLRMVFAKSSINIYDVSLATSISAVARNYFSEKNSLTYLCTL